MERKLSSLSGQRSGGSLGATSGKAGLAATNSALEEVRSEQLRILGEIDALKNAFRTGSLAGEDGQDSIGKRLAGAVSRVEALERTQANLLQLVNGNKRATRKPKKKIAVRKKMKTVPWIRQAFKKRQYKNIVEDAPSLLTVVGGRGRGELRYILSESLFKLGRLREAALSYDALLKEKSVPAPMSKIQLRMGDCFRQLGDNKTALVYYSELIDRHPTSDEAKKAESYLKRLGKG